jgi:hypothetical protein
MEIDYLWHIKKGKATLLTDRGGAQGCETSRLPHFLDNRLTYGGEVVSLTHRPPFTSRKIAGTHFCSRLSRPQGRSAAGRIRSFEESSDIGNRTRDLPACSIVPASWYYIKVNLRYQACGQDNRHISGSCYDVVEWSVFFGFCIILGIWISVIQILNFKKPQRSK